MTSVPLPYADVPPHVTSEPTVDHGWRIVLPVTPAVRRASIAMFAMDRWWIMTFGVGGNCLGLVCFHLILNPDHLVRLLIAVAAELAVIVVLGGLAAGVRSRLIGTAVLHVDADTLTIGRADRGRLQTWNCRKVRKVTVRRFFFRPYGRLPVGLLYLTIGQQSPQPIGIGPVDDLERAAADLRAIFGLPTPPERPPSCARPQLDPVSSSIRGGLLGKAHGSAVCPPAHGTAVGFAQDEPVDTALSPSGSLGVGASSQPLPQAGRP